MRNCEGDGGSRQKRSRNIPRESYARESSRQSNSHALHNSSRRVDRSMSVSGFEVALRVTPFKGVRRFVDISGMLADPCAFRSAVQSMECAVRRIGRETSSTGSGETSTQARSELGVDLVMGLDARGFVLGAPLALALGLPFAMVRKEGKLPDAISASSSYRKEYAGDGAGGEDRLCMSRLLLDDSFRAALPGGDAPLRVLIVDDLVATGGSLQAALDLITEASEGRMVAVAMLALVELPSLGGRARLHERYPGVELICLVNGEDL